MQTRPDATELLQELVERAEMLTELDAPQVEAWVSGLFALFDDEVTAALLVEHCESSDAPVASLVTATIAELTDGLDPALSERAGTVADQGASHEVRGQLGTSKLENAWRVAAPFGTSIVLGFDGPASEVADDQEELGPDTRHCILVELGDAGEVEDLQLAGPAKGLVDEVAASSDRVVVTEVPTSEALAIVVEGWPDGSARDEIGPGFFANQQFVRRRIFQATNEVLPALEPIAASVDIRRGLDDAGFAEANRAALATLQAAVGNIADSSATNDSAVDETALSTWVTIIRGDAGDLSARERDALLWLEWADWLGVGIGLLRAGAGAAATGASFVDYVNRCPEVSSTIDKADRDYAEWAFEVALDLLADVGVVDDQVLTDAGWTALGPAMLQAWSPVANG